MRQPRFLPITFDAAELDRRLKTPPALWEVFAILMDVAMVGIFVVLQPKSLYFDLGNYLKVAQGDFGYYYYAYWLVPLFTFLGQFPAIPVYIFWSLLTMGAVWFAARVFGGNMVIVLLSYQMFYILFQGQLVGLVVGALALLWWGMAHRRWELAGLGMIVAASKFQTGITFGAILWLLAPIRWRERFRLLLVPVCIVALSLIVYLGWIFTTIATIQQNPPESSGNLALWRWIGPAALVLWLPPLLLPLARNQRIMALGAAAALAVPYFQQTDLITLLVMPIGWLALLGNLGYFILLLDNTALQLLAIVPLLVYITIIIPAFIERVRRSTVK